MIGNLNSIFKQKIKLGGATYDADAQAYFTANTAITSDADKNAINTFYLGLKTDGIYTKIKAMYLPIWGSAASSKWNLKDPRDLDAAFRLTFATGYTFSSGGMLPNGTSAYADTFLAPSSAYSSADSKHLSFYSRTNSSTSGSSSTIGSDNGSTAFCRMTVRGASNQLAHVYGGTNGTFATTETSSLGFYLANRSTSTASQLYKNGSLVGNGNSANGTSSQITQTLLISAARSGGSIVYYDNKQCAFASIGDSLTATEVTNFSNRVNTLLAYFGINTYPVVSDSDAQAYINANDAITSQSDANAINTFFTGLKADGIYTKIKAMYLPIWGSASASKWNLKDPRDLDAAFRLTFATGMTYTSGGMQGNGTSAIANTQLIPSSNYANGNSIHISIYSRTNNNSTGFDCGCYVNPNYLGLYAKYSTTNLAYFIANVSQANTGSTSGTNTDSRGFFIANRTASNVLNGFKNSTKIHNSTIASTTSINYSYYLCGLNSQGTANFFTDRQYSFASIGDGLTDTEASNFYNRVQTLMTYFGINV